jgi:hypothetical protein
MKDGGAGAIYIFLKNNKKLIRWISINQYL